MMRGNKKYAAALIAFACLAGLAHADDDPLNDPAVQKTLRGMANASTWYHPDLFGEFTGMRYYAHHQFKDALKYFEVGAYYADKLSQLSIGLMHMNGEGTKKDPVTAYAWLDLAAERDYPDFVATRDSLKKSLTPEQLTQAESLRKTLGERYGDNIAKHRLAVQLKQGQMQLTGSHTGFDYGVNQIATKECGPSVVTGGQEVAQAGCGGASMYSKDRWDPDLYFASRDREFKATVSVGSIQETGKAITTPPTSAAPPETPADKPATQH